VASTYLWSYRLQSEEFPRLGPKLPPLGRRILILSEDGERALRQAEDSLRREGLGAEFATKRTIHEGPFVWDMIEIQVKAKAAEPATGPGQKRNLQVLSFRGRTRRRNLRRLRTGSRRDSRVN
jgi:hypothetical protein